MTAGYLAVLALTGGEPVYANSLYRGVDRTPPLDFERVKSGAGWPTLGGGYEPGLLADLAEAEELAARFQEILGAKLEVLFASDDSSVPTDPRYSFAGYDIAADAPFYSLVGDVPADADFRRKMLSALNRFGLLEEVATGRELHEEAIAVGVAEPRHEMRVWQVWLPNV